MIIKLYRREWQTMKFIQACRKRKFLGAWLRFMMTNSLVDQSLKNLRKYGLRLTKQRKAMLEVLAKAENPLSAEETHSTIAPASCDLVTVYRSLEQFERIGVVQMGVRENGTKVYCLAHGHDHHHHLTCRTCGRTERVDLCLGKELEDVGRSFGFTDLSHVMEVFGTCPDCRDVS
ncbi:MAG: Fur family transcriptional regulator [Opitutae bacterium]